VVLEPAHDVGAAQARLRLQLAVLLGRRPLRPAEHLHTGDGMGVVRGGCVPFLVGSSILNDLDSLDSVLVLVSSIQIYYGVFFLILIVRSFLALCGDGIVFIV